MTEPDYPDSVYEDCIRYMRKYSTGRLSRLMFRIGQTVSLDGRDVKIVGAHRHSPPVGNHYTITACECGGRCDRRERCSGFGYISEHALLLGSNKSTVQTMRY